MCHTRAATIGMLVDDVLLDIFDFCRIMHYDCTSSTSHPVWDWHILVHVCRRWRQIIFDSPRRLHLRILCTSGSPVRKNLGIWPAFPINLRLLGRMEPKDEDNAIAALEHRDRVNAVRLWGTGSQMRKMAGVMQEPFPVLTQLCMRSDDEGIPVLTAEFLGGSAPHLQEIALHRITFPALPTLLLSTSDLVTLYLLDIPIPGYISPERMVEGLAALPKLKEFAILYENIASSPDRIHPPPVTRPILPALTKFLFKGAFKYLEDLVARIDTPQLGGVHIIYLYQPDDFQVTQVSDFVDRSIGPSSSRHANALFRYDRVTFTLYSVETCQGWNRRAVATTISHEEFNWPRMSDVAWVLSQFSAALSTVVNLELQAKFERRSLSDYAFGVDWLHLLRQFPAIRTLYVYPEIAVPVSFSLQDIAAEMVTEVLPSLGLICLEGKPASSLEKIVAFRRFSDHPITVVETREEFDQRVDSY
jgi:hypothetical protein